MKIRIADVIAAFISLLPFAYWVVYKDTLPDAIPVHWNINGKVNGWQSKETLPGFLAMISGIGVVVYCLLRFLKKIDPKRSAQLNEKTAVKVGIGIIVTLTAIQIVTLSSASTGFNITQGVLIIISLFFAFLGNVMYNIKPNYFIGLRLPWTLEDPENWRLTHRLAGILWFIGGLLCAVLSIILSPRTLSPIFFSIVITLVVIPAGYSFILFRKGKSRQDMA